MVLYCCLPSSPAISLLVSSFSEVMFDALVEEAEDILGLDLNPLQVGAQRQASLGPGSPEGRCRALLIGINYTGSAAELKGCVNDVKSVLFAIKDMGFTTDRVRTLVEDTRMDYFYSLPTKANILSSLNWLVESSQSGDSLFLHFSGHGASVKDSSGDEDDGMDEAMAPLDYLEAGLITDDEIYDILIRRLPKGVRLTAVLDCCHSGTLLDLPYLLSGTEQSLFVSGVPDRTARSEVEAEVVMFSGCRDNQTSSDVADTSMFGSTNNSAGGACTNAFLEVLYGRKNSKKITYITLLQKMRSSLRQKGFQQVPQLSATRRLNLYSDFDLFKPLSTR